MDSRRVAALRASQERAGVAAVAAAAEAARGAAAKKQKDAGRTVTPAVKAEMQPGCACRRRARSTHTHG